MNKETLFELSSFGYYRKCCSPIDWKSIFGRYTLFGLISLINVPGSDYGWLASLIVKIAGRLPVSFKQGVKFVEKRLC